MKSVFLIAFLVVSSMLLGQTEVSLQIIDAKSGKPIVGATILALHEQRGTTTDFNGHFSLTNLKESDSLRIQSVGYKSKIWHVKSLIGKQSAQLTSATIGLSEVEVMADFITIKEKPISLSTIPTGIVENELGSREFPQLLEGIPSAFTPRGGGGYGDAHIYLRGFDQPNIAVMVNGVPINEMQQGQVYWNNWGGIFNATQTIQVQRGLGASRVAVNSVGGTVNIITKTPDSESGGFVEQSFTDYGLNKTVLGLSTGDLKNGWALSFIGSHTGGTGYIDATSVEAWSFFVTARKEFSATHALVLTSYGAPQTHGQRPITSDYMLSKKEHEQYGNRYNNSWGTLNGKEVNEVEHSYFKPQFTVKDYWQINKNNLLNTSVYASIGFGTGKSANTTLDALPKTPYQNQIDWDAVVEQNQLAESSEIIFRNSCYNHEWYGANSTLSSTLNNNLKLTSGVDGRYYIGHQYREVADLLGGNYYNAGYLNPEAEVGSKIDFHNNAYISYAGLFSQIEYESEPWYAFAAATVSETFYRYKDLMYPQPDKTTANQQIPGYSIKGGISFSPTPLHTVYANGGYFARAPYFPFVFINWGQDINEDATTEKISSAEVGYRLTLDKFNASINGYITLWSDRWMYGSYAGSDFYQNIYFKSIEEKHQGIELDMEWLASKNLTIEGFASVGDWHYSNNASMDVYDDETQEKIGTYTLYTEGLKVPNAPQTQAGIGGRLRTGFNLELGGRLSYNANQYASFNPSDRSNPDEAGVQAYKIPSYALLDLSARYFFTFAKLKGSAAIDCYNVLNEDYISEGMDGAQHDIESFRGFWGYGQNFNFSVRLNF